MSDDRKPSKIYIPHTKDEGCNIVGILEQVYAGSDTQDKPIALVRLGSHFLSGYGDSVYLCFQFLHGSMGYSQFLVHCRTRLDFR